MAKATITITVRGTRGGRVRDLTVAERLRAAKRAQGGVVTGDVWPIVTPFYGTGNDDADKITRARLIGDAYGAASDMVDKALAAVAKGHPLHIVVERGAVLTTITHDENGIELERGQKIYSNVVGAELLADLCTFDSDEFLGLGEITVEVEDGAEDPRDYVPAE